MKKLCTLELEYQKDSSVYIDYFINLPFPGFLDSCAALHQGEHCRYDIMTAAPSTMVTTQPNGQTELNHLTDTGKNKVSSQNPFTLLSELLESMGTVDNEGLPFAGGALGYWSYELCEHLESKKITPRQTDKPLMEVGIYHWALITDHHNQQSRLIFHPEIPSSIKHTVLEALDQAPEKGTGFYLNSPFSARQSREQYQQAFNKIMGYLASGDCYEVNLTQQFSAECSGDLWTAYKTLRTVSPAPHSAFIKTPAMNILSHSPERFIRVRDRHVETHPIKGTRPRGATPEEDKARAEDLLKSPKDRSENLMIVDLMRNDLGRICETGSIKVPRLFALESYANVHHLVSTVTGVLPENSDQFSLLASTFPGGSITGAPKIRSMEIIRELEPEPRSIYCGSIGYASCCGNMDTSIAIRTMASYDNRIHCWGGGAIVADSDCEEEYQESITKVKNLMHALESNFQQ